MDAKDKRIVELEGIIKKLLEEIERLKERIAILEKHSGNSSKPPSSDIVKPPKDKDRRRKKRKIGAQKGHKKHSRTPFNKEQLDNIIEVKLEACPKCKGTIKRTNEPPKVHQQVDFNGKTLIITEYRRLQYQCDHCKRDCIAKRPLELKSGLFSANLIAVTAYLKGRCHISYTTLQDFYKSLYSINVSTGFLANQIRKASEALKQSYEELVQQLPNEEHLHSDETGHKHNGKRYWTWCLRAKRFTVFHIDSTRSSIVLEYLLGSDYEGTISSDYYAVYCKFARLSSASSQYCWSHLIREIKYLADSSIQGVCCYGNRLLEQVRMMFKTLHCRGKIRDVTWFRRMYAHRDMILKVAWQRLPNNKDAINIAERLWNACSGYFHFIVSGVPPTNNLCEQSIRRVVIDRKITQGTRSDWGDRWQERIWSVLSTCAQTGRDVLSFLRESVSSLFAERTFPSLLKNNRKNRNLKITG